MFQSMRSSRADEGYELRKTLATPVTTEKPVGIYVPHKPHNLECTLVGSNTWHYTL